MGGAAACELSRPAGIGPQAGGKQATNVIVRHQALRQRTVADVPDEGLALLVRRPGHADQRGRISGDGKADVTGDRQPHQGTVPRARVREVRYLRPADVVPPDDPFLRLGQEPGDGAAGDADGAASLVVAAAALQDGSEHGVRVVAEHLEAEGVPASAIVPHKLGRDGHQLDLGRGAAAGGEHEDALACGEQRRCIALPDALDVRPDVLVGLDGHGPPQIVRAADRTQSVLAAEIAVGDQRQRTPHGPALLPVCPMQCAEEAAIDGPSVEEGQSGDNLLG